jgi:hypothetical protein
MARAETKGIRRASVRRAVKPAESTTRRTVATGSVACRVAHLIARQAGDASAMNRACHRHTTGLALPDRRMISGVPQPSALARMILARQT